VQPPWRQRAKRAVATDPAAAACLRDVDVAARPSGPSRGAPPVQASAFVDISAAATPSPRAAYAGARVARVAVDDDTWAAFREVCGAVPASVRLGQLVEADVQRAREATPESEAAAAVRAIHAHADALEAQIARDAINLAVSQLGGWRPASATDRTTATRSSWSSG
jgi:hypothetical protein